MKKILLLVLLAAHAHGVDVMLRLPASMGGGKTLPVSAYSSTTPAQITFEENHDVAAGDRIYCTGMRGNPKLRGHLRVKAVLSDVAITVTNLAGTDVPGTTGSGIDIDGAHDGVQLGFCGKVAPMTLRDHPRTIWPLPGSPEAVRMTDPDGTGPQLAPAATDDPSAWAFLQTRNDAISSQGGCDGRTPASCPVEDATAKAPPDRVSFGFGISMLALGWKIDATKERWKNAALYYMNHFELGFPPARPCYGCFTGTAVQSEGDDNEYASFAIAHYGYAYSLLRDEMTEEERTTFVRKIWNDKRSGCTNMLADFSGRLTGDGTALTTPDAGDLQEGDTIHIRTSARQYSIAGGDLLDITVTGTTAVAHFAAGVPMPRTGTVRISGSGVAELDNWFGGTIDGQNLTFTTSAAEGVYNAAGMELMSPGAPGDRTGRHWVKVVSIDRTSTPQVVTVNLPVTTVAYNSPWAKVRKPWDNSYCGVVWLTNHHESHDFFENIRTARPAAGMTISQTFITLTPETWPEFEDLQPPYLARIGTGEILRVTGTEPANRRLIVERGYDWTVPAAHSSGTVLVYTPDTGAMVTLSSNETEMIMGHYPQNKVNSFTPPLLGVAMATAEDAVEARWFLEHFWNLYYDFYYRIQKRLFAGPNYAGPANMGYAFGRWAEFTTVLTLSALHSFTTPIDLRYSAQKDVLEWAYTIARPGDKKTHVSWGDSGVDRYYEKDEMITVWTNSYLYPGAPETSRALDFYEREWNWSNGSWTEEWIVYRMLYTNSQSPRTDYTTGPLARVFDQKEPGLTSIAGGMHSRSSWTDPMATLVWAPVVMGGDHNGPYMFPGAVILVKGKPDLISGSSTAGPSGVDVRTQYAVQVMKTNGITAGYGQNSGTANTVVRIAAPAPPGGGVVELQSDNSLLAVPRYVTVPEGATTAPAPSIGYQSATTATAKITLQSANQTTAYQRVNAAVGTVAPQAASLMALSVAGPVTAGSYALATLTLSAPAPSGGTDVTFSANHASVALPATLRIRGGVSTGTFYVSVAPGASGTFRVTATSANSVTSEEVGIVEAAPLPVTVVNFGLSTADTGQGGLRTDGHGRVIARSKLGVDFAYLRSDNSQCYDKTADSADVQEAHRDVLHLRPASGQEYVFTYDRILHTKPGHQDVLRIPYHRMSHWDGGTAQDPAAEYERSGMEASFISREYGVRVNSKVLLPSDPSRLVDDNSSAYGTRLTAYAGQELENDMLAVHQPCANETCTAPVWRLIPSSEGQRAVQIDDASRTWIVTFTKGTQAMVGSFNLIAEAYSGPASFVITGLSSVKPFTQYSVIRDGVTLLDGVQVAEDGTLRFDATYGTGGAFTITSTGSAPLEILTHSLPAATAGSPYSVTLNGQGGVPPYSWSVASGTVCAGLALSGNRISGTPTQPETCTFSLRLTDDMAAFVERSYTLTVKAPSQALVVATNSIPAAGLGEAYDFNLTALGGEPPYVWSLASGTLPPGISLAGNGKLSGTPTAEGDFPFVARVTDSKAATAQKAFEMRVPVSSLVLETAELPVGYARTPYEVQLTASGGLTPYTWSVVSGDLPDGWTLQSTGLLQGVSAAGWSSTVTIRVQDWTGRSQEKTFQVLIRNSSGLLGMNPAAAGRTRLAIRYGNYGLTASTSCRLDLSESANFGVLLESWFDGGGSALRTAVFGETQPLQAGHAYHARVTCGAESVHRQLSTAAAGAAVARLVWIEMTATSLSPGERAEVEYGASATLGASAPMTCGTRCVAAVPGTSGEMLYHRTVVLDSADRVLRRGQVRVTVPD